MNVIHGLDGLAASKTRSVLTMGNFDGVHRAHQHLLARARTLADQTGGSVAVLTFEPHPLTVVAPSKAPPRLTPESEKLRLLELYGVDTVVVAKSEPSLLSLQAESFIELVVRARFNPAHIVEGPSFGFGKGRKGTAELLQNEAKAWGCVVHIVPAFTITESPSSRINPESIEVPASGTGHGIVVSSSLIRRRLIDGDLATANDCLGRSYGVIGMVVEGASRGRTLGVPTANLGSIDQLLPKDGVYAGQVCVGQKVYAAAINVGTQPTFQPDRPCVEAHLLDFSGDLYGQTIRVDFERFLRPQCRFESAEGLRIQLQKDIQQVRETCDSRP